MDSKIIQLAEDLAKELAVDESGVTAIEYGLLAALIAIAILGAVSATGTSVSTMYTVWSTAVRTAISGAL